MSPRVVRALTHAVLVMLATAAGGAVGGLLGGGFAEVFMPNAGLEALLPVLLCAAVGSVGGAFVQLAVVFRATRARDKVLGGVTAAAGVLLVIGAAGFLR